MIVVNGEYPKDCLHCNYRHCLHIGDKYYQMCGLNGDGYLTESWFKSEDLVDGFKSKYCPIQGEYEEVFNHDLSVMDIDYLLEKKEIMEARITNTQRSRTMEKPKCCDACKFYEWYYDKCKKFNCEVNAKHLCSMYQERKELSEHEKFILSQMANSDAKTIEKISLMYQKQLAEIYQNRIFT